MARNMPDSRAVTAGTVRFWYNVWHDLAQLGGSSDQGLLNQMIVPPTWDINKEPDAERSILWMQVIGVGAVIVNGKSSQEYYKDMQYPDKFRGKLQVIYDNGSDDVIYSVPRRSRSIARVVDRARHDSLGAPSGGDKELLRRWYELLEHESSETPA